MSRYVKDANGVWHPVAGLEAIDSTPTQGSTNAVSSGGVYASEASIKQALTTIVENGNTCTHTGGISKGQYVLWKGNLYTADSNISVGETFASSGGSKNLTACADGGLNELANGLATLTDAASYQTLGTYVARYAKVGRVVTLRFSELKSDTVISGLPIDGRPPYVITVPVISIEAASNFEMGFVQINTDGTIVQTLPNSNHYYYGAVSYLV